MEAKINERTGVLTLVAGSPKEHLMAAGWGSLNKIDPDSIEYVQVAPTTEPKKRAPRKKATTAEAKSVPAEQVTPAEKPQAPPLAAEPALGPALFEQITNIAKDLVATAKDKNAVKGLIANELQVVEAENLSAVQNKSPEDQQKVLDGLDALKTQMEAYDK